MSVRIKWNRDGFRELRSAPGVRGFLESKGSGVLSRAGDGHMMDSKQGNPGPPGFQGRWRVTVWADSPKAKARNARDKTLLRALGGAG